MELRKTVIVKETIERDQMGRACEPITRVAALAVVKNPFAGKDADDFMPLFDMGRTLGDKLMPEIVALLGGPAVSYGKGAIVGVLGEAEQGHAMIHPKLGKPMRHHVGGGKAVIVSNAKVGSVGASLDMPLGHKDEVWSFDHFDTMTLCVPDAPRPDEIVLCFAVADGGRAHPRCGDGPITD